MYENIWRYDTRETFFPAKLAHEFMSDIAKTLGATKMKVMSEGSRNYVFDNYVE